jgi:hypothetical protein
MAQVLKLTREQIPMMIKGIASPCGSIYLAAARTAICCYRSQGAADRRVIWGHLRANHVKETFRNLDLLIVKVREQLAQIEMSGGSGATVSDRQTVVSSRDQLRCHDGLTSAPR